MTLETQRLLLRPLRGEDAETLFAMDSDPEVMRYLTVTFNPPVSPEPAREWIRFLQTQYYNRNSRYGVFAAEEKASGELVGWFILRPALEYRFAVSADFQEGELELGYRFQHKFWGRGLGTEGSKALIEYAREDPEVKAIVAIALIANRASTRVMEKAGLKRDHECSLPGYPTPAVVYRLDFPQER